MKKLLLVLTMVVAVMVSSIPSHAQIYLIQEHQEKEELPIAKKIRISQSDIKLFVQDKLITRNVFIVGDVGEERAYIPVRKLIDNISASVLWDGETKTMYIEKTKKQDNRTMNTEEEVFTDEMLASSTYADDMSAYVKKSKESNNELVMERIVIINGRSYLPLRAVGELLGLDVIWNGEKREIDIYDNTVW